MKKHVKRNTQQNLLVIKCTHVKLYHFWTGIWKSKKILHWPFFATSSWHEMYSKKVQHVKMIYNLAMSVCVFRKWPFVMASLCVLHCMSPDSAAVWPFLEKKPTNTHTQPLEGLSQTGCIWNIASKDSLSHGREIDFYFVCGKAARLLCVCVCKFTYLDVNVVLTVNTLWLYPTFPESLTRSDWFF